jgi:hypothetical protein
MYVSVGIMVQGINPTNDQVKWLLGTLAYSATSIGFYDTPDLYE